MERNRGREIELEVEIETEIKIELGLEVWIGGEKEGRAEGWSTP